MQSAMPISVRITIALSIVQLVSYVIVVLVDATKDAACAEWRVMRNAFVAKSLSPNGQSSGSTNSYTGLGSTIRYNGSTFLLSDSLLVSIPTIRVPYISCNRDVVPSQKTLVRGNNSLSFDLVLPIEEWHIRSMREQHFDETSLQELRSWREYHWGTSGKYAL